MPNIQSEIEVGPAAEPATIADLPFHVSGRHPKPLLVGRVVSSVVEGQSTKEWFDSFRDVALGLAATGITTGDRVAIMSESRPEWLLADLAVLSIGAVTVPIYPTQSAAQAKYILEDSGARLAIVSTQEQLEKIQHVRHELPRLEAVAIFEPKGTPPPSVLPFAAIAERGHGRIITEWGAARQFRDAARGVRPEQLATIIYTSGTTGEPKGVMLSHANLVANLISGQQALAVTSEDVALSFLPLSHAFERMVAFIYLGRGITIVFAESLETIRRDIQIVRPTIITGVPRLYEKFESGIRSSGALLPQPRRALFQWGLKVAASRARAEMHGKSGGPLLALEVPIAERLVFSKIRQFLGGRLRCLVSGSAPLPDSVAEFFHGIGLPITEGYGLTETAPILTVNPQGKARIGTVGPPVAGVELTIAEDGEILARGANIMSGYYNKPSQTADVLRDGWFHTGDIGTLDSDGYLRITDRKKDLIVTSGGKKIAPQPIETILKRSPLVAEAVVLGDRQKFASALIVPDFAALERRLRDLGRSPAAPGAPEQSRASALSGRTSEERDALVAQPDVVALYEEIVEALNRQLAQFERIKKIRLLPREFSIQAGELTPSLKVRRKVVEQNWRRLIDDMYGS